MRQSRRTQMRRRVAVIGGFLIVALAAVVVGVVWSDQAASAQADPQSKDQAVATVPAGVMSDEADDGVEVGGTGVASTPASPDSPASSAPSAPATQTASSAPGASAALAAEESSGTAVSSAGAKESEAATVAQEATAKVTKIKLKIHLVKGERLVAVTRQVDRTTAVGGAALKQLLSGPTKAEKEKGFSSAIPAGTRLRGLSIKNGVATVDLTREFASGGGSSSMHLRLGQVVYTLTEFPTVDEVRLWLDGAPVKALGGEGLLIPGPLSRAEWNSLIG